MLIKPISNIKNINSLSQNNPFVLCKVNPIGVVLTQTCLIFNPGIYTENYAYTITINNIAWLFFIVH